VLNEKLKRRIKKTRKENQQILIAGAVSERLSTAIYRTTTVKFLLVEAYVGTSPSCFSPLLTETF
jgi:hypothetical protein